jgi:hypothetical protein
MIRTLVECVSRCDMAKTRSLTADADRRQKEGRQLHHYVEGPRRKPAWQRPIVATDWQLRQKCLVESKCGAVGRRSLPGDWPSRMPVPQQPR